MTGRVGHAGSRQGLKDTSHGEMGKEHMILISGVRTLRGLFGRLLRGLPEKMF